MGAGTMPDGLRSVLLGTAGLWAAGVAALLLTLARTGVEADSARLTSTARLAAVTVFVQVAHFAEEFATGFYRRFPELLGLSPWSPRVFLTLNLFWLGIWCVSIGGLKARRRVALFPLWFLGIACVVNAVAHAAFSIRAGGYFPGLVTSPFVGAAGISLLRRLFLITCRHSARIGSVP